MTTWRIYHTIDFEHPLVALRTERTAERTRIYISNSRNQTVPLDGIVGPRPFNWGYTGTGPLNLTWALVTDLQRFDSGFPPVDWRSGHFPSAPREAVRIHSAFVRFLPKMPWWIPSSLLVDLATGELVACSDCSRPHLAVPSFDRAQTHRCQCGLESWNCEADTPRDGMVMHDGLAMRMDGAPYGGDRRIPPEEHWLHQCNAWMRQRKASIRRSAFGNSVLADHFFPADAPIVAGPWPG